MLLSSAALTGTGCRGQTSKETPIVGIRNMYDQPKYDVQEESDFFPDKRTMRPVVLGSIAREQEVDRTLSEGRTDDNSAWVLAIPERVVQKFGSMDALLTRGQERYDIYCTPCHDATGSGNGLVKQRAVATGALAFAPPTYHQEKLRHIPDGQLYATIANGKGNMPAYPQVPMYDRWAIVGYVRALQISQAPFAPKEETPPPAPVEQKRVELKADRILVNDQAFGSATSLLTKDGRVVLGEVADVAKTTAAEKKKVTVTVIFNEGPDMKAKEKAALDQANAVGKALVERGVPAATVATRAVVGIPSRNGLVEFLITDAKATP